MSSDENVVTTTAAAPKRQPKSFSDLKKDDLVSAARYFGTLEEGNTSEIKADLAEAGVTWKMYAQAFKLEGYEDAPDEDTSFEMPEPVDAEDWPDAEEGENVPTPALVTASAQPKLQAEKDYLIKFVGENPYFEFGKYKFTQEKPFGVMPAKDAQDALVKEPDKFRQAFPAELQEYYK